MSMATAQDARRILHHVLEKLKDPECKYAEKYKSWIERSEGLEEALWKCLRKEVIRFLELGSWSVDAMRNIGGELKFDGRAIYLYGVLDSPPSQLLYLTRTYIGQSIQLSSRLRQHYNFRYRRDNPSLHYHAVQNSIFDVFSVLAVLPTPTNVLFPGNDEPPLLLNVMEMWCALLFSSLQPQMLREWLPDTATPEPTGGLQHSRAGALNIANPLHHGLKSLSMDWLDLSHSVDPLIRDYLAHTDPENSSSVGPEKRGSAIERVENASKAEKRMCPRWSPEVEPASVRTVAVIGVAVILGFVMLTRGVGLARLRSGFGLRN
ncbi:hypothetical protein P154DRAFT_591231 [Amniculicola lignicola CBS 123094]|uniref:Uncharacterized protein n=1 Tax=Amniculicola lignicola CBS 123094 TaxID=1392246 RepID=A0A6A5WMW4_9PLEO|nr:hypothetical protein P154DRAFT_591231 [Amniculicola lignicola CBS 123094]